MNIELERQNIIEELANVNEEWIIKAIKRILFLDDNEISTGHKQILDKRIDEFEKGTAQTVALEDAKKRFLPEK